MYVIGLIGEPGVGKSTIGDAIREWMPDRVSVISVSALLPVSERGLVLADETMVRGAIEARLYTLPNGIEVALIDSAPRTIGQVFWLTHLCRVQDWDYGTIEVKVPTQLAIGRLGSREGPGYEELWIKRYQHYWAEYGSLRHLTNQCLRYRVFHRTSADNAAEIRGWLQELIG